MTPKHKYKVLTFVCLAFVFLALVNSLSGCNEAGDNGNRNQNFAQNRNSTPNSNATPNANASPKSNDDIKEFSESFVAAVYKPPPTPDGGGGDSSSRIADVKEKLTISSIDEIALVLTPEKYPVTVESLQLDIYSGDKKLYTVPTISTRQSREFPPIEKSATNATGYVFNLDPQRTAEANRYFVNENNVRVVLTAKLGNTGIVTIYLVDKNSEVGRGKQAR